METEIEQNEANFLRHFSKDSIQSFVNYQISRIMDGIDDALEYKVKVTALKKALDYIDISIKDQIMSEATKYGGKTFNAFGAEVSIRDTGVSYKYEECGDTEWEQLDSEMKGIAERKKERENFLKSLKSPITVVDESSGETTQINPPIKKGSESVVISFK